MDTHRNPLPFRGKSFPSWSSRSGRANFQLARENAEPPNLGGLIIQSGIDNWSPTAVDV